MFWLRSWLRITVCIICSCSLLAEVATAACPKGCTCHRDQGLLTALCTQLPSAAGKVESLIVLPPTDNPLQLFDGQFNSFRHLKYLNLSANSIYSIHKKVFFGAKNLIEIDLSYNDIEVLEPTVFQHMTSLSTLLLRGNRLRIEPETPFLISNSIQHLDIGQCQLKSIPRYIFYGLKRLRYLSLDGNFLKSLQYNSLPKGLKYLDLSQNRIINVPIEELSSLTNLRKINLRDNPINCSCSLLNFQDWFSGRGVIFEDDVFCSYPPEYSGVSWSKVNENSLCLAETRYDEVVHDTLTKNKLQKENSYVNGSALSQEDFQSDQPQTHPNSQVEVLFKNSDTVAMGEMMRDEEHKTLELAEDRKLEIEKVGEKERSTKPAGSETETELKEPKDDSYDLKTDVNTQNNDSDTFSHSDSSSGKNENNKEEILGPADGNGQKEDFEGSGANADELDITKEVDLNSHMEVYKHLSEMDINSEMDDFRKEGLLVGSAKYKVEPNITSFESTDIPDVEETTDVEKETTQLSENTSSSILTHETDSNKTLMSSTEASVIETTTPLAIVPTPTIQSNDTGSPSGFPGPTNHTDISPANPEGDSENSTLSAVTSTIEQRIKEVPGAEVVMFCVGVLVICLVLYSIYKCRNSKKRTSLNVSKDAESNRGGTEMQDMATLITKTENNVYKTHNYPDKAPPSETEKLLLKKNEEDTPQANDFKNNTDSKNLLNNNAPSSTSPTNKTPLLKPENPITINPAAPIQRTKVKVSVIPDSIPKTPIFLQKAYTNGTKHV